jgi:glycosyltransferase involved in cell wall biosynthesis
LIIGPTPPPHHGVSESIRMLLNSELRDRFRLVHLDLADRRGIEHVDRPDLHDAWLFLKQWLRLLLLLARGRPDIAYLAISQSTLGILRDSFLLWPCLCVRARLVLHLHGGNFRVWYESRGPWMRWYVRHLLARVTRVIVLGERLTPIFHGLVCDEKLAVIPNGVAWNGRVRTNKPGRPRVLHLGTLSRAKGTLVLLRAAPLVLEQRRDVEFVLAGSWLRDEHAREAERLIAEHGLHDHVIRHGHVEGPVKVDLFTSADLFVFPGIQQEGQPLVVLEAMAAGLAVVFTDRGCLGETVGNGEAGVEAARDDPADLARCILKVLASPEAMRRMGEAARRRYEMLYTAGHFGQAMTRLFLETYRAAGPGARRPYAFDRGAPEGKTERAT